jgi:cytochrome c biogenesis protein CcmG, thiol:disulfide interchange protein DsbE
MYPAPMRVNLIDDGAAESGRTTQLRHLRFRPVLGVVAIGVALAVMWLALTPLSGPGNGQAGARDTGASESPGSGIAIGMAAPEFVDARSGDPLLRDLDSRPIRLSELGGPVWIVFWATWCTPCQQEAGDILALAHAHASDGLHVLAIDVQEPAVAVRSYADDRGLDYDIGLDPTASVRSLYGGLGLPTHIFLDGEHLIRDRYIGQMTRDLMEQHLRTILP